MKKWEWLFCLLFVLTLGGCGQKSSAKIESQLAREDAWGIVLTAKDVASTGLALVCSQQKKDLEGDLETGSYFSLEQKQETKWEKVEYVVPEDQVGWTLMSYLIPKGETVEWEVGWSVLYGSLPPGQYRILKTIDRVMETGEQANAVYGAEFVIE